MIKDVSVRATATQFWKRCSPIASYSRKLPDLSTIPLSTIRLICVVTNSTYKLKNGESTRGHTLLPKAEILNIDATVAIPTLSSTSASKYPGPGVNLLHPAGKVGWSACAISGFFTSLVRIFSANATIAPFCISLSFIVTAWIPFRFRIRRWRYAIAASTSLPNVAFSSSEYWTAIVHEDRNPQKRQQRKRRELSGGFAKDTRRKHPRLAISE